MSSWRTVVRNRIAIRTLGDHLDQPAAAQVRASLALARERLDAADLLWLRPHRAESMPVLARALEALEAAIATTRAALPEPVLLPAESQLRALREARERLHQAPADDDRISKDDLGWRRAARRLARGVIVDLRRSTRRRREVLVRRVLVVLAAAAFAGGVGVALTLVRDRVEIVASGSDPGFGSEGAADGNPGTEWFTPDGQRGWVELRWRRPRAVTGLRVINSNNVPFKDRAARDLDIELLRDQSVRARTRVTFDAIEVDHRPREVAIAARDVNRVRLTIASFHGRGGGLADVQVLTAK